MSAQTNKTLKKLPLHDRHQNLGAHFTPFAGWNMPIRYTTLVQEHTAVRQAAGLFDISHMGVISIQGTDSEDFLNALTPHDMKPLKPYKLCYTFFLYPSGGVVDDTIIYKKEKNNYFLISNASNHEKDLKWLHDHQNSFDVDIKDISHDYIFLALQGPNSPGILKDLVSFNPEKLSFFSYLNGTVANSENCMISKSGYTGETGFEMLIPLKNGQDVWESLLKTGSNRGLIPCGLGARDTLRFEAGLPLYGNELSPSITPLEAGLSNFVNLSKEHFVGKEALMKQKESGLKRKIKGFTLLKKAFARHGCRILSLSGDNIGTVTTGYLSPSLNEPVGMALIDEPFTQDGQHVKIEVRKRTIEAVVRDHKFYKKKYG